MACVDWSAPARCAEVENCERMEEAFLGDDVGVEAVLDEGT